MKSLKLFIPAIVFLLFSCNDESVKNNDTDQIKAIEAKGYVVPRDCVSTPKAILVDQSKLKRKPAGNPTVLPTNINIHPAGIPVTVSTIPPVVCTPGSG